MSDTTHQATPTTSTTPNTPNADQPSLGLAAQQYEPAKARMPTRRGLIRAGLGASPVILTLASRPVLAWQCKAPSAHASANLSNHAHPTWNDQCTATSTAWLNKCNGVGPASDGCGTNVNFPSGYSKTTQCNVLMGSGSTSSIKTKLGSGTGFEKTLITAMLNVKTSRVPSQCVTVQTVKDMWSAGTNGTQYQPSAGVFWNKQDMVNYLHNNWIATVSSFGGSPPSA